MPRDLAAEPLVRRALAINEKSFGPDHPDVARDLNNLALLMTATNRHAEAEPLVRRALAIAEKSFGPDHPNVARDLNNLALLLTETDRHAEAEPLYRRALAIAEKSFGPDHPNVARDLHEWEAAGHNGVDEFEIAEFLAQDGAAPTELIKILFGRVPADA